ncbi:Glycine/D-amino acid oxidase [Saccharopolyspora antimicrobica]|uniref:Glycine/D-amino acid oxidase n=1 Tax=Saccharopolyspora antimicrobica TaxID=455193 RepID=A0A1I4VMC4_9PSEU|nr:FAD-binding oxidoreductase [Saccharopolyspora antimicrobica]RKT87312.1 glycine/D-amino acid oxidase-like deaminating enzyme [Saccharopolyspora antimicrobica]SFN02126.1 Glycine/D-amino acid oxidase [Saccharopolyspora antimicrobica]
MTIAGVTYSPHSGWVDPPTEVEPPLAGEFTCDVAVVGGGLAGMAAALRLAERGADVVLVESGYCGWGASSRNAGQLTGAPAGDPQLLSTLHPRRFRGLVRFAESAVGFTEKLIGQLETDCEYEPTGNVGAAVSRGQLRKARRNASILRKAGADAEFADGRDLGLPDAFLGGILERVGGILNPGKFARGVREAVLRSGSRVFERTAVRAVRPTDAGVVVEVPGGRVRAERVVLATNAHSRELAIAPKRLAKPIWVSMAETGPIEPDRLAALGWTSRSGIVTQHNLMQSYRLTGRGTIAFGVRRLQLGSGALGAREPDPAVVADLACGFYDRFPSLRDVALERAWGGWIALTPSWLPVAGEATRNIFYAIGCNGHGLAQAPYLGTLLADRLAGEDLHEDLGAVWRTRPRFVSSPLITAPVLRAGWAVDRMADRLGWGS